MKKSLIFTIAIIAFFAVTAVLLAVLPWAGYTLLILSCLFTIIYELRYANHQIKFFNNLRKQGAMFEISGMEVTGQNTTQKVSVVGFKDKIMVYNQTSKAYYNFKDVSQFIFQQKSSVAYGGFVLKFHAAPTLKVLCLSPEKIRDIFENYYKTEVKPYEQLPKEFVPEHHEFVGNPPSLPAYPQEGFEPSELQESSQSEPQSIPSNAKSADQPEQDQHAKSKSKLSKPKEQKSTKQNQSPTQPE